MFPCAGFEVGFLQESCWGALVQVAAVGQAVGEHETDLHVVQPYALDPCEVVAGCN